MAKLEDTDTKETPKAASLQHESLSATGQASMQGEWADTPTAQATADTVCSFRAKDPELYKKYPEGVEIDEEGYPDFSPYAIENVEIDMQGNYTTDYKEANAAAGLEEKPEGIPGITTRIARRCCWCPPTYTVPCRTLAACLS